MPTPTPPDVVRCNVVWDLSPGEIAVNTLNFKHEHHPANTLDWAGDMTQRYANLVRDAFKSQWTNLSGYWSAGTKINRVDAYHLGEDGLTIDKATAVASGANAMAGGSGANPLPPDVAVCVSLYGYDPASYDPQGARKRGRIYLPAPVVTYCQSGRFGGAAAVAQYMAAVVSYMQKRKMDALPAFSETAHLVVLSRKWLQTTDVSWVRVDDLFDTQTRRQSAWLPVVSKNAVVPQQ